MPDNDVWPPRPDLPDPLTEYDELIRTLLEATEPAQHRLALVKALREKTGLNLSECLTITNSYCTRNGIVFRNEPSRTERGIGYVSVLILCAAGADILYLQHLQLIALDRHLARIRAIDIDVIYVSLMVIAIAMVNLCLVLWRLQRSRQP